MQEASAGEHSVCGETRAMFAVCLHDDGFLYDALPAEELEQFNANIEGTIEIVAKFKRDA